VHHLLSTIDDHSKLNERINKHYQKRLSLIESDLQSLALLLAQDLAQKPLASTYRAPFPSINEKSSPLVTAQNSARLRIQQVQNGIKQASSIL
jgi:hypothetical protein